MLQREKPDDYVLATGTTTAFRDFVEGVAGCFDTGIAWTGQAVEEVRRDLNALSS